MKIVMRTIPLLALVLILACAERDLPTPPTTDDSVTIEQIETPEFLDTDSTYSVSVKVTAEQPVDFVRLLCMDVQSQELVLEIDLYDDGAAVDANDGDVIANDGVFSQVIEWPYDLNEIRDINLAFMAHRGEETELGRIDVTAQHYPNIAPQITLVTGPDTLKSGIDEPIQFILTVDDPNGVQDVTSVSYTGVQGDNVLFNGELVSGSQAGTFVLTLDSTFAAGNIGEYELRFVAKDQSETVSTPFVKNLFIENNRPVLLELDALSTFTRPSADTDNFLIQLTVNDDQGLGDIKQVWVSWQKPDGTYGGFSPYELFDNGLEFNEDLFGWNQGYRGDLVANDGIYSITAVFDADDDFGRYTLTFWAEDLAGNTSDQIIHFVTLE